MQDEPIAGVFFEHVCCFDDTTRLPETSQYPDEARQHNAPIINPHGYRRRKTAEERPRSNFEKRLRIVIHRL